VTGHVTESLCNYLTISYKISIYSLPPLATWVSARKGKGEPKLSAGQRQGKVAWPCCVGGGGGFREGRRRERGMRPFPCLHVRHWGVWLFSLPALQ
jgi:hypothetical protein